MVNKARGKWLCAAADTYFHVWGGLAALGFKLVFHSHSVNTFSYSSRSSTNSLLHSLTAKERLGLSGVLFSALNFEKARKQAGNSAHFLWLQG